MARRLRLGIIGLGRRWPRYHRALLALAGQARAVAVYDDCPEHARQQAAELSGCAAVPGVLELIERDDVEALLLPGGPWFGAWPLEAALRAGKPALWAPSLPLQEEEGQLEALRRAAGGSTSLVHVALWPVLQLLETTMLDRLSELGEAQLALVSLIRSPGRPSSRPGRDIFSSPRLLALLSCCASLLGGDPLAVRAVGVEAQPGYTSVTLEFPQGRLAQLTTWEGATIGRGSCSLQLEAENGSGRIEVPHTLDWHDAEGRHSHRLPSGGGLAEMAALTDFIDGVRRPGSVTPACDLGRACQLLGWLRAARQSLSEGRRVEVERTSPLE